ncbi:hypothetical protein AVEN_76663-1 [Araneus ventricosus]|uniref:Uncharacterized protein n=1 Tax=Araneus ventricosus TaxID=182803 RepID=A0A4Y2BQE6_ARAVE|nr:hypothetical protein AVEN_76663-1 [Araneus ventricosus]
MLRVSMLLVQSTLAGRNSSRPQRIVVARGFVRWLERAGEMSVNARFKEASRRTETSVQFLRTVANCVCVVRTSRKAGRPRIFVHRDTGIP